MAKSTKYDLPVKLSEGNRLYLYRLLARKLGIGQQAFMPKVIEALEADGLAPELLGYADARALLEAVGEPFKITVFKGGRLYVTVQRMEAWDEALAAPAEDGKGKPGKPWKRKKAALKPVRPKVRVVEEVPAAEAAPELETALAAEAAPEPGVVAPAEETPAAKETPVAKADAPGETPAVETGVAAQKDGATAGTPTPTPILEQIAAQARAMEAAGEPASHAEGAPQAEPAIAKPRVAPTPTAQAASPKPEEPAAVLAQPAPARSGDFPQRFSEEVSCKSSLLALLTRILPIDVDVMAVLDEDWRVARATGTYHGSRSRVTFPLRYLQEDGSAPVEVTIRRSAKPGETHRWALSLIDGDDGTGHAHEAAGLEGLPVADHASWEDLAAGRNPEATDPIRAFVQYVQIGTWDSFLGTLATAAAPEHWDFPGEGVGKTSRYGMLREYVAATFARVAAQGRLSVSPAGDFAAFATGLVTAADEDLYVCLEATGTDIPWRALGFATAGSGELGSRMAASLGELPRAATLLESLDDVRVRPGALVVPDYRALLSATGLARLPQGFLAAQLEGTDAAEALEAPRDASPQDRDAALIRLERLVGGEPGRYRRLCRALDDAIDLSLRRARRNYRHVASAYDPIRDRTVLLLPLALVDDARVDCALALVLQPSGAYQATSVVTLPHARSLARVVCSEMPSWL